MLKGPMESAPFGRVAARLAETIDTAQEYTVVENDNIYRTSFIDRHLFSSEYRRARALLTELLAEYDGVDVEGAVGGQSTGGPTGSARVILSSEPAPPSSPAPEAALERLHRDLRLVRGVGPALEARLHRRGYREIGDLRWHRRLAPAARGVIETLDGADPASIARICTERHGASHPGVFLATELYGEEEHVYLDLETLGLFSRPVILFGIARLRNGHVEVEQHLVADLCGERDALEAALGAVAGGRLLVSFNGRSFDVPYLAERAVYYGIPFSPPAHHLDLLPLSRRCWRERLPDCRLGTIEAGVLGYDRGDDMPSAMVPEFYAAFQRTGNPGPLLPILAHNREDLVSMVRIVAQLREVCHAA